MKPLALWALDAALHRRRTRHGRDLSVPRVAQLRRLAVLVAANADTEFGRLHDFPVLLRTAGLTDLVQPARRKAFAATPADRLRAPWGDAPRAAFAEAWRKAVPVRAYGDFQRWIQRTAAGEPNMLTAEPVLQFALTSGSTSVPKLCPVTRSFIREHHDTHLLWMQSLAHDHPAILPGPYLTFASPAETSRTPAGIPCGASSGRQAAEQSWPVRRKQSVPAEVFGIEPHAAKYYAVLVHALGKGLTIALTVNPSTLVLLADVLAANTDALLEDVAAGTLRGATGLSGDDAARLANAHGLRPRPKRAAWLKSIRAAHGRLTPALAWPELAVLATWQGGCAPFYRPMVASSWGTTPQRCLGLRASEGTFTIPDCDNASDGVFAVGGHGVEFFPEDVDPARSPDPGLWVDELDVGKRYRMVITTGAGLYRYDLADIVETTGRDQATPRLAFIRRAGGVSSMTGEKVTEDQASQAFSRIQASVPEPPELAGYTLVAVPGQSPHYALAVEPRAGTATPQPAWSALRRAFDAALRDVNAEYDDRRAGGRLSPVRLWVLSPGTYAALRADAERQGRPDGQWKPPLLIAPVPPRPDADATTSSAVPAWMRVAEIHAAG